MEEVRDPLYKEILLPDSVIAVLHHPQVRILMWRLQLPLALVGFPGAIHSRYSHALGTLYQSSKIRQRLSISETRHNLEAYEEKYFSDGLSMNEHLAICSLLRDIDKPPFYSFFEEFPYHLPPLPGRAEIVNDVCRWYNERIRNDDAELKSEVISKILNGKDPYRLPHQIIESEVGANVLDYLHRDSFHCGVNYGLVDERLYSQFLVEDNQLVLRKGGIPLAQELLTHKFWMRLHVYELRENRALALMVDEILRCKGGSVLKNLSEITDAEFFSRLVATNHPLSKRLKSLDVYRQAFGISTYQLRYPEMELPSNELDSPQRTVEDLIKHFQDEGNRETLRQWLKSEMDEEFQDSETGEVIIDVLTIRPIAEPKIGINVRIRKKDSGIVLHPLSRIEYLSHWYEYEKAVDQWRLNVYLDSSKDEEIAFLNDLCDSIFQPFRSGSDLSDIEECPPLETIYDRLRSDYHQAKKEKSIRGRLLDLDSDHRTILASLDEQGASSATSLTRFLNQTEPRRGFSRTTIRERLVELEQLRLVDSMKKGREMVFSVEPFVAQVLKALMES